MSSPMSGATRRMTTMNDDLAICLTNSAWNEFLRLTTPEEFAAFFAREDIWTDENDLG
jgi:hypothetical protein